jgi:hypothetical protein
MVETPTELSVFILAILAGCNERERKLRSEATKRGTSYESLVAGALSSAILERWALTPRGETN